jgi:hypothetical protein
MHLQLLMICCDDRSRLKKPPSIPQRSQLSIMRTVNPEIRCLISRCHSEQLYVILKAKPEGSLHQKRSFTAVAWGDLVQDDMKIAQGDMFLVSSPELT